MEVWDKGFVWDTLLGSVWIPLMNVEHGTKVCFGLSKALGHHLVLSGYSLENSKDSFLLLDMLISLKSTTSQANFMCQKTNYLFKEVTSNLVQQFFQSSGVSFLGGPRKMVALEQCCHNGRS